MYTILRFPRNDDPASRNIRNTTNIYERYGLSAKLADASVSNAKEVAELIDFWQPDGCVVNNDKLPEELFAGLPTVFLHRDIKPINPRHATVRLDEKAIATAAAHHLLSLELASYAYVPPNVEEDWSRLRAQHFVRILGLTGHGVACYTRPKRTRLLGVILAIGHSAHDTYQMLQDEGVLLEDKGFAMGVRAEHPQALINRLMYHDPSPELIRLIGNASYSLVTQVEGRGVYSFCMCPGGHIVPAGSRVVY